MHKGYWANQKHFKTFLKGLTLYLNHLLLNKELSEQATFSKNKSVHLEVCIPGMNLINDDTNVYMYEYAEAINVHTFFKPLQNI